jgi:hypothetical protein
MYFLTDLCGIAVTCSFGHWTLVIYEKGPNSSPTTDFKRQIFEIRHYYQAQQIVCNGGGSGTGNIRGPKVA